MSNNYLSILSVSLSFTFHVFPNWGNMLYSVH